MSVFGFLFVIPFTVIYLGLIALGRIYFYMGIVQVATGFREQDPPKRSGGLVSILVSAAILALGSYVYFKWVWPW